MRFMLLMIPQGYETAAADAVPSVEQVAAMTAYNTALFESGVLIGGEGLHPPATGARISFADGKPRVVDGPFPQAKEMLGGYWMIDVASREVAIEWAKRCPASPNEIIEVRRVQEFEDFPPELQAAAGAEAVQA
ncbi:YciI family protein [Lysobacter antibioticus]|uniref:YciI family protein n=1 Tax=Lysobacter antibioticus TaxID=84531 RepID=UPI00034D319C|nr:YciI family protein [Lysobacter antibioticus]